MATFSPPVLGSHTGLRTLKELGLIHAYPVPTSFCRKSSLPPGEGWPDRSTLTPQCHHGGIVLHHRAARISANQRLALAGPGLPTEKIKTAPLSG